MMPDHQALRRRIHGPTACLPILYRDDLSVDHEAMAQYATWIVKAGITCTCMTHGYSQQGYITAQENLEITRTYASAIGDRALFLAATLGELWDAVPTVDRLHKAGAHGVFLLPPLSTAEDGNAYARFVCRVAAQTEAPLFVYSYGSRTQPGTAMLSDAAFDRLLAHDNFVGLKEDVNNPTSRLNLVRRYGDRLGMIGGGVARNYLQFHHHPCQSELLGFHTPRWALRFTGLLDERRLFDALRMIEDMEGIRSELYVDLFFLVVNQVIMHALGFARNWKLRPPLESATPQQAERIMAVLKRRSDLYEPRGAWT